MSEAEIGRRPLTVFELEQPRCTERFGVAGCFDYDTRTPTLSKSQGDAMANGELANADTLVSAFVVDFAEEPNGTIWEMGGSGAGSWLGVDENILVWRVGSGGNLPQAAAAVCSIELGSYGLSEATDITILATVEPDSQTAWLIVMLSSGTILASTSATSDSAFTSWTGTNSGGIGFVGGGARALGMTNDADWNSTITSADFYQGADVVAAPGCRATGTPCYNTGATCGDLQRLNSDGSIRWRFTDDRPVIHDFADFSDPDNPATNAFPTGLTVSTSEGEINTGAILEGSSPLGVTGTITVSMPDFPFNDHVGDFYLDQRPGVVAGRPYPVRGGCWALWAARNDLFTDMYMRRYDGYEGQALADMRQTLHKVDTMTGPSSDGAVSFKGEDPLRDADDAEFPRTSNLDLYGDIDDSTTTLHVFGTEADLSDSFGNTAPTHYLSIGEELISYTGYTAADEDGVWTLTGVQRGVLGTEAVEHADEDAVQRAGRYVDEKPWHVLEDLFVNHTAMRSEFVPIDEWDAEGNVYLPTYKATRTIVSPTTVSDLAGSLTQQGLFYIWWEPYEQLIKLLAIRAPKEDPITLTDDKNLIRGTELTRDPDARLTQVTVYYNQIDPFDSDTSETNYRSRYTNIDGENLGDTAPLAIYAPWIRNRTQAVQLAGRLLIRYRGIPKFLRVTIDAKDRAAVMGSVVDVETAAILNPDGSLNTTRWQVIGAKEVKAGHTYLLNLQTYEFIGRFGVYQDTGAPDYDAATEVQKASGGWYADANGLLSDDSEGYKYQ